ncbi:MAG: putative manganese-dependent inorganic diphosphatase [Eggerthellaceae bacterium]|nr:putative manganese-dependent inorganic diphosphatase [Eggerthellaceae bacterium]
MTKSATAPILVVGHRNPDNDSIASAVAYAHLKNALAARTGSGERYVPARLGPLPTESAAVLTRFGLPAPEVLRHVHARVADVMTPNPISIGHDATLMEAGRSLRTYNVRALVVTNDDGTYAGLITTRMIAERYISATDRLDDGATSNMAVAADLIASLNQRVSEILETEVLVLNAEDLLKDAVEELMASALREAVVLDEAGFCIGIVTRTDVAIRPRRRVILVDHNETRQAAPGIEEASVVEIIDHHRIADVMTANPIQFLNMPVGSTATIITMEYRRHGVEIPREIAGVLLSAIMTDTVVLKSPTTTPIDHEQAAFLGAILEEDPVEFGLQVFRARGNDEGMPIAEMVGSDAKEFTFGDDVVLIAQHETVDLPVVMAREAEIRAHLRELREKRGYGFVMFGVTDIFAEGTQLLVEGDGHIPARVFGHGCLEPGGVWLPGVLSRKKQIVPRLMGE